MYFSPILYFCLCDFVFVGVGCGGQSWQQVDPRGVETSNTVCYRTIDSYKAVAQWTTLGIPFQFVINIYSIVVEALLFLIIAFIFNSSAWKTYFLLFWFTFGCCRLRKGDFPVYTGP